MATHYQVDPDKAFQSAIKSALKEVKDLTIPFTLITKSWFKGNQAIFSLKGPGKYVDLTEKYQKQKAAAVGFVYPILKRSGALAKSITQPSDGNSINYIINKQTLVLGTKIPYGPPHQFGAPKIKLPQRPFILLGAEQVSPPEVNRRREAWIAIIEDYVLQVSGKFADTKS